MYKRQEQCLEFLADDELLEVTPKNLRIRKTILNKELRDVYKRQCITSATGSLNG